MSDPESIAATPAAAAMWRLARTVADPSMLDNLTILGEERCSKRRNKSGRCGYPMATLYETELGPVLVAFVPDGELEAGSRDRRFGGARSEIDVVDAILVEFDGWHPAVPEVQCWQHPAVPFDRDRFLQEHRARPASPFRVAITPGT